MKCLVALIAILFAVVPASADPVLSTGLTSNASGQPTAHYGSGDLGFDLFVDILNADGSSRCSPGDPCTPPSPITSSTSITSRPFDPGEFMLSFQALQHGVPITVTGAGLNQEQTKNQPSTPSHSFFDVYFDVVMLDGTHEEGALGIGAMPMPPPITPADFVTDAGKIGWSSMPSPPPIRQSTFFLDPMAFESFDLTLQTDLFLPGDQPPTLDPNPNVVPEPHHLLLLALATVVLLGWHRFRSIF